MSALAPPVRIVTANAPPFVQVSANAPPFVVYEGDAPNIGVPITVVTDGAPPITLLNEDGSPWTGGGTAPVNSVAPVVSGSLTVGSALSVTDGTWSGSPTGYTYQWKRDATNVGTNANSYTLVSGDVGASMTCVVTATNAAGSASATSNALGPVVAVGGAALLAGETDGFAVDFTYVTDANRVAKKVASVTTEYGLDGFFQSTGTSPKMVFDVAGTLGWAPHNLALQSQTFDNTNPWNVTTAVTVTANATTAPDGTATADKLVETASSSTHGILHSAATIPTLVGQNYTISVYAKAAERSWLAIAPSNTTVADWFDLTNGVLGTTANAGAISAAGSGWYRCSITFTAASATSTPLIMIRQSNGQTAAYTGDGTSGIYVWGAQMNRGSVPLVYMPTTTIARYGLAIDYHPVTHAALGLLAEKAATNLLLNSTTLSTQSVTVTAVAHTLSFFGTGTITLTGVSTAGPLVGTGASDRVTLTFTPTAGSLTLTVSGSVTRAQLETGAVATSPIPTFAASATRTGDLFSFQVAAIPAWTTELSMYCRFSAHLATAGHWAFCFTNGPGNDYIGFQAAGAGTLNLTGADAGGTPCAITGPALTANVSRSAAARIKLNDCAMSVDGGAVGTDTAVTVATPLVYGCFASDSSNGLPPSNYRIQKLVVVPRGWDNATLILKSAS
jgi:hypothetical protein